MILQESLNSVTSNKNHRAVNAVLVLGGSEVYQVKSDKQLKNFFTNVRYRG